MKKITKELVLTKDIRNKVIVRLKNKNKLFKNEVFKPFRGDIVIIYRIEFGDKEYGIVNNKILETYFNNDICLLDRYATLNTSLLYPIKFKGMMEQLMELMPLEMFVDNYLPPDMDDIPQESCYVLTNEKGFYGAASILYPDVFDLIRTKVEGNFFLIPSSVHELLILPYDLKMNEKQINHIIREVNTKVVEPDDFLSNDVLKVDEYNIISE